MLFGWVALTKCATGSASALRLRLAGTDAGVPLAPPVHCGYACEISVPHRKQVRHFEGHGHLHELTLSCFKRKPLLTNDLWRGILARSLDSACETEGFDVTAFVFMPEHVHLLVVPKTQSSKISRMLARTKQPTSRQIKQLLVEAGSSLVEQLTVRERSGKYCFRFLQESPGFDGNIFTTEAVEASISYIHENPVKRDRSGIQTEYS